MYNKIWAMLQVGQLRNNGSIPGRGKRFFSSLWHPNCLWPAQTPIPWASWGCSSKVKWLQHKANHSPPQKAYVKNGDIPPSTHHQNNMQWGKICLHFLCIIGYLTLIKQTVTLFGIVYSLGTAKTFISVWFSIQGYF
jgi:hypothetical protein